MSHAVTVPPGRGGRALWRPLRTNTDRNTGRGPPERNRQTGSMAEPGALEAMVVQGAQEAMVELGALAAMAELGALEAMAVQGAQEAMADGLQGLGLGSPRPGPYSQNSYYPPQKFPWGSEGVSEPSGAKQTGQYKTRQERPPGPDRQDRTAHRNRKPSWAGLEAEASSGHDKESGALTGSLSNRFHFGPRRVSVDMTDKIVKMFLWARHDIHTALLAHLWINIQSIF